MLNVFLSTHLLLIESANSLCNVTATSGSTQAVATRQAECSSCCCSDVSVYRTPAVSRCSIGLMRQRLYAMLASGYCRQLSSAQHRRLRWRSHRMGNSIRSLTMRDYRVGRKNCTRLFTARCTIVHSAVLPPHVVRLSVRLSVRQ